MASSAELIEQLGNGVKAAYAAIKEKGGELPEQQNVENLASTITDMPSGGITPRPPLPEYPYPVEEFDGGEYGAIAYLRDDKVHYYTATSENDLTNLAGSSSSRTFKTLDDGFQITNNNILAYAVGSNTTTLGDYFLRACSLLQNFYWNKENKIVNTGAYFLYNCPNFIQPMDIPEGVRTIGNQFLSNCISYNQPVTFPSTVDFIGDYFLYGCTAFNSSIKLPQNLSSIGTDFLRGCSSFNQPIAIPAPVKSISNYFMSGCSVFNNTVRLEDGISSLGIGFLSRCVLFNQPLVLPDSIRGITEYNSASDETAFLGGCRAFNQPLDLPASLTATPLYFMNGCTHFDSEISFRSESTNIGGYFMINCTAFNKPIALPSKCTSIGEGNC